MALLQNKLAVTVILLQIAFVVLFALVVRYDDDANAAREKNSRDHSKGGADPHNNSITRYYASKLSKFCHFYVYPYARERA